MQRNECKPGTEVIIRGTIKEDDGTDFNSIKITIRRDDGKTEDGFFDPSQLEPARTKYDPARKYRKGDLVRITGFHGRLFGGGGDRELSENNAIGTQIALHEDEIPGGDVSLPDGFLLNMRNYLSVACIELVKPIEEIEAEHPYEVKEMICSFRVTRGYSYIYTIWWKSDACPTSPYSKEEALRKAQELCDELNRKHRESMNA
ncbi:hypothetical protein CXU19_13320 [Akkermansia muciniphila]|jgi:hypothetical protein|nr:hypothetical protein CXU19_13320 [Akkermansia muciniphila]PNC38891.1 hypothetical protein CXU20_10435 [Akkermansia muciniphila]